MEEKKEQLDKVCRAFQDTTLRSWIPRHLLAVLEQCDDIEDTLSKFVPVLRFQRSDIPAYGTQDQKTKSAMPHHL